MELKVLKFGGTSMADANAIKKVSDIIKSDSTRRYVIVSAPGKRDPKDKKITDMLYLCYHEIEVEGSCKKTFSLIRERYKTIVDDLKLDLDIENILNQVEKDMYKYRSAEFCASRGEYLSAVIMASKLGFDFVDAKDIITFTEDGDFLPLETNEKAKKILSEKKYAVIPGFYGSDEYGTIKTFSRGGSDVTGAIISRAVEATIYENWTDVNGFMSADPRIVNYPKQIKMLTYRELRELSYMGANVLHPESIFPVRHKNIPINIRNTFEPENPGTMIVSSIPENFKDQQIITGIAGKKGYSIVYIEKSMMNNELGFARKALSAFEYCEISFEHMPTGIDTLCIVVPTCELEGKVDMLFKYIKDGVSPDKLEVINNIALIATVGHGMSRKIGTASTLFNSLTKSGINIRMIDQGSSELNIIVGVDESDYETALRSIYDGFLNN